MILMISAPNSWIFTSIFPCFLFNYKNKKEALVTDNHIFVTDQHGREVDVKIEVMNPKIVEITPVKPYNYGQTYYLFMKDLESDTNVAMENQTWMKFMIGSQLE
ncbi:hypothetical protein [Lysinibacillus sp. BW-2-10]|uniref:hypothetical protein n=1 Tax=Lysinibacillus sp. BW-2-10 TaxID=2590030 RepID=UPI00118095B9|nr:hypothetical protein [Lysinibacillus sp. BW-2-10]TSI07379.1 hypothetical protein FJQ64_08745 [Lysinibacillus sp. BW-2-10]